MGQAEMATESRLKKTMLNARVNLIFYLLTLVLTFFSRKIFLENLGADFIGLTGTLGNILGYLNLAELGIGAAISFNLYKPLQTQNHTEVRELVSLFGYYYRNVGLVVLGIAIIVSGFFPLIFKNEEFPLLLIYFAFYGFLSGTLIGYFINYRTVVLSADQRNYVVSAYFQTGNILKTILQLLVAIYYANYYAWIAIELIFGIIYSIILNKKIDKTYPWLKCSIKEGKQESPQHPGILRSTRQVFVHKIKDFILTQSDQLFVFAFVSLKMVAYYGNYVMIILKLTGFFGTVMDSASAGVGNLVAEGNKHKMLSVFWELVAVRYFVAGIVCYCIYILINPFISLWLGSEYILSNGILIVMLINQFIFSSRGTVDNFNFAYGHYADVWSAWTEGIINITATCVFGYHWGIVGILLGKTVSLIPIIVIWKPYYLYRDGFNEKIGSYWRGIFKYYLVLIVSIALSYFLLKLIPFDPYRSIIDWIVYAFICTLTFGTIYMFLIIKLCPGGMDLIYRLPLHKIGINIKQPNK